MALDFPASPTNGQVYGSYVYNSTVGAWQAREDSATVATISTVFPTSANPGDIWYDSDDGTSYIYYDDGTSAQWVELLSSGLPLLSTKANLSGDNSFSGGVNYFGAGGNNGTFISSNSGRAQFTTNNAGLTPLTVRGIAGQTNALQEWQDSTGAVILKITSSGNLSVGAAATPLEKIHATGRILGSSASYYSTNVIGTSIGESSDGNSTADIDMRRWKGSANLHGTGRIATDINSNMLFYTDDKTTNTYASTERMKINASGLTVSGPTVTTAISDAAYNRVLNPAGGFLNSVSSSVTGALRIVLPVGWTDHMNKFSVSVFHYLTGKSFTVEIAGYNYTGGSWFNPTAYIVGQQNIDVNYTVRFGYTAGGKACIYIGETTSVWNYPKVAVNNVLVGHTGSSSTWLSGWVVDTVTAFENVSQTVSNTQIRSGLVPIIPSSVTMSSGSATIGNTGRITYSGGQVLTVYGVFSSAYRNYRLVAESSTTANPSEWQGIRYVKTSDSTVNTASTYQSLYTESNSSSGWNVREVQSATNYAKVWPTANYFGNASLDIYAPYETLFTVALGQTSYVYSGDTTMGVIEHSSKENTSYSGFSIITTTSSNISGKIQIYGYN